MNQLQNVVVEILDEHSGGLKMMELVAELSRRSIVPDPERLETEIEEIPSVKILSYRGPDMGEHGIRVKQFVYRKL